MLADQITAALDDAPRFAILGLSMRDQRTRDRAKEALAEFIAERLTQSPVEQHPDQLRLRL